MKKEIILGLLGFVLLLYALCLFSGITTVVIPLSEYKARGRPGIIKGQMVSPLQRLDFEKGKWVAYLVIAPADYRDLNPAFKKVSCFRSEDVELFNTMKKKWDFKYTGGDLATVSSALYFGARPGAGEMGLEKPAVQNIPDGHLRGHDD